MWRHLEILLLALSDSTAAFGENCKAETWGMESNRDRVIQWKWMAQTVLPITEGERLKKKKAGKGREEGEMTGDCVGRERGGA